MKYTFLILTFLFLTSVVASENSETEGAAPLSEKKAEKETGHSVAPLVGYDPTYKLVAGAAYFYESEAISLGVNGHWNFNKVFRFHPSFTQHFNKRWAYTFKAGVTKGFDPYYGEGANTLPGSRVSLWGMFSHERFLFTHSFNDNVSLSLVGEARQRSETPEESGVTRRFPDENTGAVGLAVKVGLLDDKDNPSDGFTLEAEATHHPRQLSNLNDADDFTQLETSFIVYKDILKGFVSQVVAAFRVMGGYTFGNASYSYRYRLGGSDLLQGYLENRFRGNMFYLQQTEVRFPIVGIFSGVAMLGFGDATDGEFTDPKRSMGFGIRIALPPDYVSQVRIDYAFGRDEEGLFANFGHTF